jgi:hypothetical protein
MKGRTLLKENDLTLIILMKQAVLKRNRKMIFKKQIKNKLEA